MTLFELRSRKASLINEMKEFVEKNTVDGVLDEANEKIFNEMKKAVSGIEDSIKRQEELEVIDKAMAQPVNDRIDIAPVQEVKDETGKAFVNYLKTGRVFENALQEGTDSEGGYLVPDEFRKELIDKAESANKFRNLVTRIQTASGTLSVPKVSSHGDAYWKAEEAEYQDGDDAFTEVTFTPVKLTAKMKISRELLNDSAFNLEEYTAREFGRRFGKKEELSIFQGAGSASTQPLGILAATGGAATGVTAAANTKITADEIIDLFYSVDQAYRDNGVWAMTDATLAKIRKLKDGNGNYLLTPGLGATPDTILGKPVITTEGMEEIGASKKPVAFGDFKYYYVAEREGFNFLVAKELYAATGQVGYFADERFDGKLVLSDAIKVIACPA